jgi:N-methylhydantoinase B
MKKFERAGRLEPPSGAYRPDGRGPSSDLPSDELRPVDLAVLTARLNGIVGHMQDTMVRTARSAVLNTAKDCSSCIISRDDEILMTGESLPAHVMHGPDIMTRWLRNYHPRPQIGDAYLHNSPYHGNSHAGDYCILVPVIGDDGAWHFTVMVKAHLADIGNSEPTTIWATCRDVYHEGALIFNCTKVQENYTDVGDIIRMCEVRIRVPDVWYCDYLAMLGAARIGERELRALAAEVGWEKLHRYTSEWFDYSERLMVDAITRMPQSSRVESNRYDPLPIEGLEDGLPLHVSVDVDPHTGRIEVDLRSNPDCVAAGINLTEATSQSAAMIGIFNSLPVVVPQNAGSFRRVTVLLRENCCVGIPRHPASCSTGTLGLSCRVANAVQRAIAGMAEGLGMADCASECPASAACISGCDPRRGGAPFANLMLLGILGGAAHDCGDGWLTSGTVGSGGLMMRDSIEVDELIYPIRIWTDRIIVDSGGAGRFRGGPGAFVEYGPVNTTLRAMWPSDGEVNPAQGCRGGHPGTRAMTFLRRVDGELERLPAWGNVDVAPGETLVAVSAAGAGYGPPTERDSARVRRDVLEGWVSEEDAAATYGVIMTEHGDVDRQATATRRAAICETAHPIPLAVGLEDEVARLIHESGCS